MLKVVIFISTALFFIACGGGGGGSTSSNSTPSASTSEQAKAQLGPLVGAEVKIYEYDNNGSKTLKWTETTTTASTIDEAGLFDVHASELESSKYYLYTVTGGYDIDANDDGVVDTNATKNNGTIRAFVKGSDVTLTPNMRVTALSEVLYQKIQSSLESDFSNIDSHLSQQSQTILAEDVNQDGSIDVQDIHAYNPITDKSKANTPYKDSNLDAILNKIHNNEDLTLSLLSHNAVEKEFDTGTSTYKLVLSKDQKNVFLLKGTQGIRVMDPTSLVTQGVIAHSGYLRSLEHAPSRNTLYISDGTKTLSLVDATTYQPIKSITLSNYAQELLLDTDENMLYMSGAITGLSRLNLDTNEEQNITVNEHITSLAFSAEKKTLFVGGSQKALFFVNTDDLSVESLNLEHAISDMVYDEAKQKLYASLHYFGFATIDVNSKEVTYVGGLTQAINLEKHADTLFISDREYGLVKYNLTQKRFSYFSNVFAYDAVNAVDANMVLVANDTKLSLLNTTVENMPLKRQQMALEQSATLRVQSLEIATEYALFSNGILGLDLFHIPSKTKTTIDVTNGGQGRRASALTYMTEVVGNTLYIADKRKGIVKTPLAQTTLSYIDTNTPVTNIAVSLDEKRIYASLGKEVYRYEDGIKTHTKELNSSVYNLALTPTALYTSSTSGIEKLSLTDLEVSSVISTASNLLLVDEPTQRLYVSVLNESQVLVYDLQTKELLHTIQTHTNPLKLALSKDKTKLFIATKNALIVNTLADSSNAIIRASALIEGMDVKENSIYLSLENAMLEIIDMNL